MKSERKVSLNTSNKDLMKESQRSMIKEILSTKSPTHQNNLSFDTSLLKCFCKKTFNESDKPLTFAVKNF